MENLKAAMASLLRNDPDRYIYPAMLQGMDLPLPMEIEAGITSVPSRGGWNASAPEEYALPTETWREVVARRRRCQEVRAVISGQLPVASDHPLNTENNSPTTDNRPLTTLLITLNLNIPQFVEDVVGQMEDPAYIAAFWDALSNVRILDPTCGSGAFLFAALNLLKPLYEACLERMEKFPGDPHFRKALADAAAHPNLSYFIYKSIILNNLYGVDLMDEAVEICKLRLFLKLAAQAPDRDHMEPLPDMDFNIRAGNTLVGYATREQLDQAMRWDRNAQSQMIFGEEEDELKKVEAEATKISALFSRYSAAQLDADMLVEKQTAGIMKRELTANLASLSEQLNTLLSRQYGVQPGDRINYEKWKHSHRPFHWFTEFYGVMARGGFDVIIGNPPYVEYSKVRNDYKVRGYETENCGNLYAMVMERCFNITCQSGRNGMIVQLPIVCTDRMKMLQEKCITSNNHLWFSTYDDRPGKLFDGLEHIRAAIVITKVSNNDNQKNMYASRYHRWYSEQREPLFSQLDYQNITSFVLPGAFPKISQYISVTLLKKILLNSTLNIYLRKNASAKVFFHNAPQYWIRAMDFAPYFWNEREGEQLSTHVKILGCDPEYADVIVSLLNSSLFYWWFILLSDCRDLNIREIENFPIGLENMSDENREALKRLSFALMKDLKAHAQRKDCNYSTTGRVIYDEFYPRFSKPIIDKIDRVLAKHYGFTEEELDFIINYDIKYRMGKDGGEEAG
jgi:hypothetical protein